MTLHHCQSMGPSDVCQPTIRRHSHSLSTAIYEPLNPKRPSSPLQDLGGMGIINEEDDIAEPYDLGSSGFDVIGNSNNY